jgi:hypothetical protein
MASELLTLASIIQCPHGGKVNVTPSNTVAMVDNSPILLVNDQATVSGCPFQIPAPSGTVPEPCVTVRWVAGAMVTKIHGTPVLNRTSVGLCYNAKQIPQGAATVASTQTKAKGA